MDQITRPVVSKNQKPATQTKRLNLALQGGGSHGAFTWGVMDRLLEDERIEVGGLVGTSAGAMNATVAAYGLMIGGRDGARQQLAKFWRQISDAAKKGPLKPTALDTLRVMSRRCSATSPPSECPTTCADSIFSASSTASASSAICSTVIVPPAG